MAPAISRIAQLEAALAKAKAAEKNRQDKLRTRKSIILGTAIADAMAKGHVSINGVVYREPQVWLAEVLKRAQDRDAWGLAAAPAGASGSHL